MVITRGGVVERNGSICTNNLHKQSPSSTMHEGEIGISDDEEGPEVIPTDRLSCPSSTDAGNETFDLITSSQNAGDNSIVTDKTVLITCSLLEAQPL